MSRTFRWLALCSAVAAVSSGCALQDTRYDYSRNGLPFADFDESILDWNFPTATSQGLLLPPERLRPVRPAIGVPWATGNPMPWSNMAPISDAASAPSASAHDSPSCDGDCETAPQVSLADADAGVHDAGLHDTDVPRGRH
jgi:hypothetical protein